jgi:hypothetical protein
MKTLIKRIGIFGFLFFLVKGLLWLIVPAALVAFGLNSGGGEGGDPPVPPAPQGP